MRVSVPKWIKSSTLVSGSLLSISYIVLGKVGLLFSSNQAEPASLVWPAIGFALAWVEIWGLQSLWGVFVGATICCGLWQQSALLAFCSGLGTTLAVGFAGYFGFHKRNPNDPPAHIFFSVRKLNTFLIFAGILAPIISGYFGALAISFSNHFPEAGFLNAFLKWAMGDSLSFLVFTPLILTLQRQVDVRNYYPGDWKEKGLIFGGLCFVSYLVFGNSSGIGNLPVYALFPFLIWISIRFGPISLIRAVFLLTLAAIWGTGTEKGPFRDALGHLDYFSVWLVMSVTTVSNMFLAASIQSQKFLLQEAKQGEENLRTLANQSPVMLWIANQKGQFEFLNNRFCEFTGRSRDSLKPHEWLTYIHPEDRENVRKTLAEVFSSSKAGLVKYRFRDQDGNYIWFLNQIVPAISETVPKSVYFIGSCTNIDEIETNTKNVENKSKAKSMFLAMASHDLRVPTNSILGFSQLLRRTSLSEQQREYLKAIESSSHSLISLLNDFLDISKIEAGVIEVQNTPFNLIETTETAIHTLSESIRIKNLTVLKDFEGLRDHFFLGDSKRLKQILTNLLSNAAKYSYDRGLIAIKVNQRVFPQNTALPSWVRFEIVDQGIGIEAQHQKDLFNCYWRSPAVSSDESKPGSGIGLTIVKTLIEALKGRIGIQSIPGYGTRIWFEIPFFAAVSDQITKAVPSTESVANDKGTANDGGEALIVEDELTNRMLLKEMLKVLNWKADVADRGDEALKLIKKKQYKILFLDWDLPDISGLDLAHAVRVAEDKNKNTKIVVVSGHSFSNEEKTALKDIDQFITKPLFLEDLSKVLNTQPQA